METKRSLQNLVLYRRQKMLIKQKQSIKAKVYSLMSVLNMVNIGT